MRPGIIYFIGVGVTLSLAILYIKKKQGAIYPIDALAIFIMAACSWAGLFPLLGMWIGENEHKKIL